MLVRLWERWKVMEKMKCGRCKDLCEVLSETLEVRDEGQGEM